MRSAAKLISLLAVTTIFATAYADEDASSEVSARILQAEMALQRKEYLEAVTEYRKAAQLSGSASARSLVGKLV